jgi:hypothetical protein
MSGTNWNITKMDEGFIRPQAMVGAVVMNGCVHTNLCNQARRQAAPYYSKASGIYNNNQATVNHGDIVWTQTRPNVTLNMGASATNAIRLQAVSVLNGHGLASDGEEAGAQAFLDSISVLGIAEVPHTPNNQGYFNILRGGIFTVLNNSKWTIQVGDYVMAYAPKRSELKDGGAGKEADHYGQAKLWFKTYDPLMHSLTGKPIYQALRAGDKSGHLPAYKKTCHKLLDSVKAMSMTTMAVCFDRLKNRGLIAPGASKQAFLTAMVDDLTNKKDREVHDDLIEKLFVLYSKPGSEVAGPDAKQPLNRMQREGMDQFLTQSALLHHYVHKNVIGQAMSTADPQHNFSIQLINYSKG